MISVIICSRTPELSNKLEENIANTIGVGFELVVINNSEKQFSIFEAYNLALKKSRGELQVFVHDDVLFHTPNWGAIITEIFDSSDDIGLIGVAGNTIKTQMPSPWWGGPGKKFNCIIQHYEGELPAKQLEYGFNDSSMEEVAVIDGVFMAMKADHRIGFNQKLVGFHNYDLDLSIKHHSFNKKVVVTNQVQLEHFSGGTINKEWYSTTDTFHRLHWDNLPVITSTVMSREELKMHEFTEGAVFISGLLDMNMKKEAFHWWFVLIKMKPYSKFHFRILKRFVIN